MLHGYCMLLCRSSVPTLGVNGSDRQLHLTQLAQQESQNLRISDQYRVKINNVLPRAHHLSIHMGMSENGVYPQ